MHISSTLQIGKGVVTTENTNSTRIMPTISPVLCYLGSLFIKKSHTQLSMEVEAEIGEESDSR